MTMGQWRISEAWNGHIFNKPSLADMLLDKLSHSIPSRFDPLTWLCGRHQHGDARTVHVCTADHAIPAWPSLAMALTMVPAACPVMDLTSALFPPQPKPHLAEGQVLRSLWTERKTEAADSYASPKLRTPFDGPDP